MSGTILASPSSGLFCGAKRRLHLLLFFRMSETPSSRSSTCDSKHRLACIGCWTTFNLDLEVAERHVISFFLLCGDLSLLLFWLAICLALRPFSGITLFVKFVQTFPSETRSRGLSLACFDLLEETCTERTTLSKICFTFIYRTNIPLASSSSSWGIVALLALRAR